MHWLYRSNMDRIERGIRIWCEDTFGQSPIDSSRWYAEDDIIQVLIRLSDRVVIADLCWDSEDLHEVSSMVVKQTDWQPGSIQTRRLNDGAILFRHQLKEIILFPIRRAPEWASALLEEWLLGMREDKANTRANRRPISYVKRAKNVTERMLDQADLSDIREAIEKLDLQLTNIDNLLEGKK